jgi:putative oxidoreductase
MLQPGREGDPMTAVAPYPVPPRSRLARGLAATAVVSRAVMYGLVALGLRWVMARVFFLSGQAMIEGPTVPLELPALDLSFAVTLPAEVKAETFQMFATQRYAGLPLDPVIAAYLFSYAEFVLPLCMFIGFATRIAAVGLLAITVLLQVYVVPGMWWAAHIYWSLILLVLIVCGPGVFSVDALIRAIYRRG